MRVSTAQFYMQNGLKMSNRQSDIHELSEHSSSQKRVLTAKDDAVAYSTLSGYKDDLAAIERYKRNITQAENRNSLQGVVFSSATDVLNALRDTMLEANNGVRSDEDLATLSQQATNYLEELLDLANTKDGDGSYIFSGYQIDKKPFSVTPDNSVNYNGDRGVRELQIAKNVLVSINQSGDEVFQKINNPIGDFSADYIANESGVSVLSANIVDRNQYNSVANNPQDYSFDFTAPDLLTVTDSLGVAVYPTAPYTAGQTISFDGIDVQLNGNPLPLDSFNITPQDNIGLFDTVKSAIDWLNVGSSSISDSEYQVGFDVILNQLNNALNHVSAQETDTGINLQVIERQKNNHLDNELPLNEGRESIEGLDLIKAYSDLEQMKVALQAAQQTFIQTQNLSLFNYI